MITYDFNNVTCRTTRTGPEYDILDSERNKILHIRGPFGFFPCYGLNADYPFQVTSLSLVYL